MAVKIDLGAVVPIGKGEWNTDTIYERANMVRHNSSAWVCKVKQSQGKEPMEGSSDWYLLVKDTSSVTSVNGKTGNVVIDTEHSVTQPLGTKNTTNATTEFVANTVDPISNDVSSLKNTIENNTIIKDNTSIIGSANKIPVAGANGKIDSSWLPDSVSSGHPLGYEFASLYVPEGCLLCNGVLYDKATYTDLFAFKQKEGRVVTEAKWQEIAAASGGYCAMYADNGSQFRVPKPAPYLKMALDAAKVGEYEEAGLPNITGEFGNDPADVQEPWALWNWNKGRALGAFLRSSGRAHCENWVGMYDDRTIGVSFDASRSSPIYGNSTTVTPESTSYLWVVQAFGVATNTGAADVSDALAKFGAIQSDIQTLQNDLGTKLPDSTVHIVETWKAPDGKTWYRKWSDGYIEQGGIIEKAGALDWKHNFLTPFSSDKYSFSATAKYSGRSGYNVYNLVIQERKPAYAMLGSDGYPTLYVWSACGY